MREYPKEIARSIRHWAERACEAELRAALQPLAADFAAWQQQHLPTQELLERLHHFEHQHTAHKIQTSHLGPGAMPDLMVAAAIARGSIPEDEVEPAVRAALADLIAMVRRNRQDADEGGDTSRLSSVL
jgi:hypothetical protein